MITDDKNIPLEFVRIQTESGLDPQIRIGKFIKMLRKDLDGSALLDISEDNLALFYNSDPSLGCDKVKSG